MKRLGAVGANEKEAISAAAVSIIGKSENIDPSEVRFLERLNKSLGLSKDKIYTDLHRATVGDEPVVIAAENRPPGIPIAKPSQSEKPAKADSAGIYIDQAKLAAIQKQTQEVSAILTQIFVDDAADAITVPPSQPRANGSLFAGLDGGHAELVEYLELKGEITREEFEARAKALKLLPDGAIETINEWSFDHFDEPLLEDGEHVVLAASLRDRLAEMRTSDS